MQRLISVELWRERWFNLDSDQVIRRCHPRPGDRRMKDPEGSDGHSAVLNVLVSGDFS